MLATTLDTVNSATEKLMSIVTIVVVLSILYSAVRLFFLPQIKGWLGERKVSWGLRRLNSKTYRIFDDLYLPRSDGRGTTQVDHVVVSCFGVFVIETKNYKGWIFGNAKQKKWTQTIYRKKSSFQNPLHQNALHVRALEQFLGLEAASFHSIIFFVGDCTFKTELPSNVLNEGLVNTIKAYQTPILTPEVVTNCAEALASLKNKTDRKTASRKHRSAILERSRATGQPAPSPPQLPSAPALPALSPCPRCGAPMVERIAKRGAKAGEKSWGCSTYPKCRGTVSAV